MDINLLKPSDFNKFPFASVERKTECEIVALNIMVILRKTGDTFRKLLWSEYKKERLIDGDFSDAEKEYFDRVIGYCESAVDAVSFSDVWKQIWKRKK